MAAYCALNAKDTDCAFVLWQSGAMFASSISADRPPENAAKDETYSSWRPTSSDSWLISDAGENQLVNAMAVGCHTLGSNGCTVTFRTSLDLENWIDHITITPQDDSDIFVVIPRTLARHSAIVISGGIPVVGRFCAGPALVFPHAPVVGYTPTNHARSYKKLFNNSITGHLLGNRVQSSGFSTDVDMGHLLPDFVEGEPFYSFEDTYNTGRAFFFASSPSKMKNDAAYCWASSADGSVSVSYENGGKLTSVSFGIQGYVGT